MTDLEITKLCAEGDGSLAAKLYLQAISDTTGADIKAWLEGYAPLHDDAQAMALVKKFRLDIRQGQSGQTTGWLVGGVFHPNLNRAICEAVANMQKAKQREAV
mgnify:CR=1 FL=1